MHINMSRMMHHLHLNWLTTLYNSERYDWLAKTWMMNLNRPHQLADAGTCSFLCHPANWKAYDTYKPAQFHRALLALHIQTFDSISILFATELAHCHTNRKKTQATESKCQAQRRNQELSTIRSSRIISWMNEWMAQFFYILVNLHSIDYLNVSETGLDRHLVHEVTSPVRYSSNHEAVAKLISSPASI